MMRRKASATIVVAAGVLVLSGCTSQASPATSTAPAPHTSPSEAGRPAGPQASAKAGIVQITGYSDSDGPRSSMILTGAIGDFGEGLRTATAGTAPGEYNQLHVMLEHGAFRLAIAGIEEELVAAFAHFPSNTSTCSGSVTATGPAPIIEGSGTGAYTGLTGSFQLTVDVHEVDSWPRCVALLSEEIFISGSGRVLFG